MTSSMPESISSVLSLVYDTMPLREPNDDDDEEEDDDEDSRTSGYQGTRRRRIGHPIVVITPIVLPWLAGGRQRGCCWNPATDLTSISRARRTIPRLYRPTLSRLALHRRRC